MTETEKVLEILVDMANGLEALAVNVKQQISELTGIKEASAVKEETFNILKFEKQQGAKIGEFEVAYKANNLPDKWASAFNVLRQNNATINSRHHGEGYQFSYWLYGEDKIYRQKMKTQA